MEQRPGKTKKRREGEIKAHRRGGIAVDGWERACDKMNEYISPLSLSNEFLLFDDEVTLSEVQVKMQQFAFS
jgi:hypothetical protein